MRYANDEKWKTAITGVIELLNQDRIWTLGEKENYEHLGILEADTIKQAEMKKIRVHQTNKKTSPKQALL